MSETKPNGQPVLRIGRKGKRLLALGDSPPREVDVVLAYNMMIDVDRQFRDEQGRVPAERNSEWSQAMWAFAVQVFGDESFTHAEALEFRKFLAEEVDALRPFIAPNFSAAPSSQGSTELRFSP